MTYKFTKAGDNLVVINVSTNKGVASWSITHKEGEIKKRGSLWGRESDLLRYKTWQGWVKGVRNQYKIRLKFPDKYK